jgi:hypothetical protein
VTDTNLVPAEIPGGEIIVVPVVDLDDTALMAEVYSQNAGNGCRA